MSAVPKTSPLPIIRTVAALRARIADWRREGLRIGLVPTMGALHEGHLSLLDEAARHADRIVVSIFVNPTQFAPHEDFDAYPRTEVEDGVKLAGRPAHLIFAPNAREMYPEGFSTKVIVSGVGDGLETDNRPHFFHGVAVVVSKLLLQALPDIAVFGEKDYQQLLVIRRMVTDLNIPVDILAGQTVREADGLAMSSRNAYLSADERRIAAELNRTLGDLVSTLEQGGDVSGARDTALRRLCAAGFDPVDYVEVRDAETLAPMSDLSRPARVLAAARIGTTRLIDNMPVSPVS